MKPCWVGLVLLLLLLNCSGPPTAAAHEGCGQHHPLVAQQQQVLRRRLQQLRSTAANTHTDSSTAGPQHQAAVAKAGHGDNQRKPSTTTGSSSSSNQNKQQQQQQQQQQEKQQKQEQKQKQKQEPQQKDKKPPAAAPPSAAAAVQRKAVPAKLRIGAVYQLSGLSPADTARVKQQLVPAAIKVLQRYIKVLRPAAGGVLKVDAFYGDGQQGCLISRVDAGLASGNVGMAATDLVLYITSDAATCLPGMIAIATSCDVDPATGRPILGSLNVCGGALAGLAGLVAGSDAEAVGLGRVVEVVVHEVVHVLGFGSTHYGDWRGPDGKRYGEDNVVKNVGGRPYLSTPKSTAVARSYFGCPSLPGAPLENEGPSFSAISHYEYRLLQRELMAPARPIDRSRSRLSAFTLAALEDTGWYVADYSSAEVLDWGRGAGCHFVTATCWDYMAKAPVQPYYCGRGSLNQTRCTAEGAGWGVCRTNAFSDGCLLVGKYSTSAAAAVPAGVLSSSSDGRQAACYSPPQLQQLAARAAGSSAGGSSTRGGAALLPLLGGSYSAKRQDICYNLVRPQQPGHSDVTWVGGHGQLPEDIGKTPEEVAAGGRSSGSSGSSGSSSGGGGGGSAQQQQQQQRGLPERSAASQRSGSSRTSQPRFTYMEEGDEKQQPIAAACVRVAAPAKPAAAETSSSGSGSGWYGAGRHLLSSFSSMFTTSSSSSSSASSGRHLAATQSTAAAAAASRLAGSSAEAAAATTDSVQAMQARLGSLAASAACTSSPVLCFKSSCNKQGELWITAQPAAGSSSSSSSSSSFACPAGRTLDLSQQLPGRYMWGFLQCPSNALVCETLGCGDCSSSGGYCSQGRCYCHMERYGPGCYKTLVPKLK